MRSNLTKKEISWVGTKELNYRYCRLLQMGETMLAGLITYLDMREILWIEDQLRERLIAAVGHDFYPPEGVAKPTMAEMKPGLKLEPAIKPEAPAAETQGNCTFNIAIISSIGVTAAKKTVKADIKGDAIVVAKNMIKTLGLKKATYEIT